MREPARQVVRLAVVTAALAATGCTAPRPPLVVGDPDPSVKIPAIKKAVREKDRSAVEQLVKDLASDDPAVRFYAINGLRRLTGQNFGYQYFDDDDGRKPAVQRWEQWLKEWEQQQDGPPGPQSAIAGGDRQRGEKNSGAGEAPEYVQIPSAD